MDACKKQRPKRKPRRKATTLRQAGGWGPRKTIPLRKVDRTICWRHCRRATFPANAPSFIPADGLTSCRPHHRRKTMCNGVRAVTSRHSCRRRGRLRGTPFRHGPSAVLWCCARRESPTGTNNPCGEPALAFDGVMVKPLRLDVLYALDAVANLLRGVSFKVFW